MKEKNPLVNSIPEQSSNHSSFVKTIKPWVEKLPKFMFLMSTQVALASAQGINETSPTFSPSPEVAQSDFVTPFLVIAGCFGGAFVLSLACFCVISKLPCYPKEDLYREDRLMTGCQVDCCTTASCCGPKQDDEYSRRDEYEELDKNINLSS